MDFFKLAFEDQDKTLSVLKKNKYIGFARVLILIAALSCFLYFTACRFVIAGIGIILALLPGTRDKIFDDRSNIIIAVFTLITASVALYCGNYIGLARTGVFACMMIIFFVAKKIMTKSFFEVLMNVICIGGSVASVYSIYEMIVNSKVNPAYRCEVSFSNANFFGVAVMFVILICAYKVVNRVKYYFIYFLVALINAVGLYLSGSMSLWLIGCIGIVLLLIFSHDYKLLAIFLGVVVTVVIAVILIPQFLPRINQLGSTTNNRILIWNFAIEQIKEAPIFGHGFFSYKHLYNTLSPTRPDIYKAALAHNLLLDSLLCHGFVGTALLGVYIGNFIRKLIFKHDELKKRGQRYPHIVFAVASGAAIACYGLMDTTFVWVQTGMILLFIISGIGADERKLRHIKKRD